MATKNEKNTDQIRQLVNKVHLAGALAELEVKEGQTQTGVPYLSLNGAIQCGESAVSTVRFRSFIKAKKSDGTDSKNYENAKRWVSKAVPMTKDKEKCTFVDMIGSLTDNPYVSRDGTLVEAVQYSTQLISKFDNYAAELDIEGFVHSIVDETRGEEGNPTGRKRMRLITRDIFSNTIDLKNIIIPNELVEPLEENGYEKGCTATFFINLIPTQKEAPVKKGGIGTQRTTEGKNYLEMVLVGADPVIDSDDEKALDAKLIKNAMTERKTRLDEIKEKGYQGSSDGSSSSSTSESRTGFGGKKSSNKVEAVDDDDEFPF